MKQDPVVTAVPTMVSTDTVEALELLLAKARNGELVGIAYIALGVGGVFEMDLAGVAYDLPIYVRGLLPALDDKLGKIIGSK